VCHAVRVQIINSRRYLVRNLARSLFRQVERSTLEVAEQIAALACLHDNVNQVLVFENVKHSNNMRVLAHFEHLDLPAIKLDQLLVHFLFLGYFDGAFLAAFNVGGRADRAEMTFADRLVERIKLVNVIEANQLLDYLHPLAFIFHRLVVEDPLLVARENQVERVVGHAIDHFGIHVIDERTY